MCRLFRQVGYSYNLLVLHLMYIFNITPNGKAKISKKGLFMFFSNEKFLTNKALETR